MRAFVPALLLALALFAPASPAQAGEGRYAEVVTQLGLSADQQAKVEEIIYQSKSARVDIRARMEKAKMELKHTLGADALDEKAVRKAMDALNAATAELVKNRVEQVIALRKVLTAAQFEQLQGIWQEGRGDKMERLRERFGRGDGRDGE